MSKQQFNNKTYTTTKVVNNILRVYNQAEKANDWYVEANEFAMQLNFLYGMQDNNINLNKVCGIIAALSPLKSWKENKRIAESFLSTGKSYHTKLMTGKAQTILASNGDVDTICDILRGDKITSFFLNIVDPINSQKVTIDRHAVSIAVGEKLVGDKLQISKNQYQFFVNCYIAAAIKLGVKPLVVQATTWVIWRQSK